MGDAMKVLVLVVILLAVPSLAQTAAGGTSIPSALLKVDRTNQRIGIKTKTPTTPLEVNGVVYSSSGGFKFPDGTTQTTASSGSAGTPAVTLGTVAAIPGTLNLSTEGTADWLDSNAVGTAGQVVPDPQLFTHRKVNGSDVMQRTFTWIVGGATGWANGNGNDGGISKSTTGTDDIANGALSSSTTYSYSYSSNASQTGYGWKFDVPCKTTSQTLNLYAGVWSGSVAVTFTLPGGQSANYTISTAGGSPKKIPVSFTCSSTGDRLRVKAVLTVNGGAQPNVQFYAATLAPTP